MSDRKFGPLSISRRGLMRLAAGAAAFAMPRASNAEDYVQSGTVKIEQVQIAFIGSGNLGGGTLYYSGKQYSFTVGGLGIGGIGISRMTATGIVYNLRNLNDFPGAYVQGRYGLALGDISTGELLLQNTQGVALRLKAERTGLALSLGGDAVYIGFD
ncbi:MAG: hypothetical protein R3D05_22275 [Dongiaceae bacterium]